MAVVLSKDVLKHFAKFTEKHFCWILFFNKVAGSKRSNHWRCSVKKDVLKNFRNLTGKQLCWILFLIKLQFWGSATLLTKTPTQVLSCEICEIFTKNYFEEQLWTAASKLYLRKDSSTGVFLWTLWNVQEHLFCRASTNDWFWNISVGAFLCKFAICKPDVLKAFNSMRL